MKFGDINTKPKDKRKFLSVSLLFDHRISRKLQLLSSLQGPLKKGLY